MLRSARAPYALALLLTVVGLFWTAPTAAQQDFVSTTSCRVYDSRPAGPLQGPLHNATTYTVPVAGVCGIPANATAVSFDVTVVGATGTGLLYVFPSGQPQPLPATLLFKAGRTITMGALVLLGAGGAVDVRAIMDPPSPGTYQLVLDVTGYFESAPKVISTTPANGASGVATNSNIVINFSENVNVTASAFALECPAGSPVPFTVTPAPPGGANSFTLDPATDLPVGVTCTVTVTATQVTDTDGDDPPDTMEADYVFSFSTSDTAPSVQSTTPTDGATGVALNTNITVQFSENVNVTASAFTLECPVGSPVAFSVTPAPPGGTNSFTLDPSSDLPNSVLCTAKVIANQVADTDTVDPPDNMTGDYTFTFTPEAFAPVVTTTNGTTVFTEGGGPVTVDAGVTVTDSDSPNLASATVTITNPQDGAAEVLAATSCAGLTVTPGLNSLSITGSQPPLTYQTCLQSVTYDNSSQNPGTTPRVVSFVANDGTSSSAAATKTVTVAAVNNAPTIDPIADPAAINEDAGLQTVNLTGISAGDSEVQPLQVTAVSDNTAVIPNPTVIYTSPNATGSLQYTPVADASGTANITVTVTDGGLDGNLGTPGDNGTTTDVFQAVVNAVNDPPTLDPIADPAAINEDAGLQTVNLTGISAGDTESQPLQVTAISDNTAVIPNPTVIYTSPNATGSLQYTPVANASGTANVTVTVTDGGLDGNLGTPGDNGTTTDVFQVVVNAVNDTPTLNAIPDPAAINEDAGLQTVNLSGISAGDSESQPLQVTAVSDNTAVIPNPTVIYTSPNATGSLQYTPVANAFGTANITVTVTDGGLDGNLGTPGDNGTTTDVFQVVVNAVNDAPSFNTIPDPAAINEDASLQTVNISGISAGPGEGTQPLMVTAVSDNTAVIPNPAVTYTSPNATGSLQYTPVANAFGTANITVTLTDGGNDNNLGTPGDNLTFIDTFQVVVLPVNDAPTADNDKFDYIGNTQLEVDQDTATTPEALETTPSGFGVVDGDSDLVEGDAIAVSSITVGTCTDNTLPSFDCSDPTVGTVHMQPNGRFSFEPAAGDTGAAPGPECPGAVDKETFTYTLTDNGAPAPASTTATVTLCRFARVWYVDPAGSAGSGTSTSPLNSLTSLNGAGGAGDVDSAGDYIFIDSGTLAGSIELESSQHLIGRGVGLSIPVNLNLNGSPTDLVSPGTAPQLTNASGDTVKITAAVPTEIVGLSLASTTGNSIDLTSAAALTGSGTLSIGNNQFRGAGAEGIDINLNAGTTGTLTLNITNNSWDTAGTHTGNAVDINRAAGTLSLNFSGNTNIISAAGAGAAVNINGGALANTTITGFSGNSVHGNSAGAGILISQATFDSNSGVAGFQQVDGDNLVIGASGNPVGTLGLVLSSVQGNLFFDDLDVYAAQTSGTALQVSGAGGGFNFSVTPATPDGSGTSEIFAQAGPAVDISSATVDLRLNKLTSTTSTSGLSLSSVGGQFRAPSGSAITKSSGGGTAFSVASSSATVNYGGTLSITSGAGVSLTSNTGSINFSGGMTLSTGANAGFSATGGGTVTVTDPPGIANNTITTTSGTALTVTNTTIGAGGLTFESISAGTSGTPVNGIVLTNTGTNGLTVTGTGTAGSGGTIRSTSDDGVSLTNAHNVSLSWMNFVDIADGVSNNAACDLDTATGCAAAIDMQGSSSNITVDRLVIDGNDGIDGAGGANPAGQIGISGHQVNGLTVTNTTIKNVGESNDESGVLLTDAQGTILFQDVTVNDPAEYGIRFYKSANTSLNLTLRRVTVQNNIGTFGEAGFSIRADGGTSNVLVDDCDLLNTDGPGVDGQAINSAALNLTVQTTTFNENRALPHAINFVTSNTAVGRLKADNNTMVGCAIDTDCSRAIDIDAAGSSTLDAIVQNNTSTQNGIGGFLEFISNDNSVGRADIHDNTATVGSGRIGMNFQARSVSVAGSTGALHLTLKTNTISNINTAFFPAFAFQSGASTGTHAQTLCVNLDTAAGAGNNVINGTTGTDVYAFTFRQRTGTTFQIRGVGGSNRTAVQTFVDSKNTGGTLGVAPGGSDAAGFRTDAFGAGGTTIENYTSAVCQTPSTPPLP